MRKVQFWIFLILMSYHVHGQNCDCPMILSHDIDENLCSEQITACVVFDNDISCIDTFIISSDNIDPFNVVTERNITLNEICVEMRVLNDSCEPIFSNITLEYVCGIDTIVNLISGVKIFPPAFKFKYEIFGIWDESLQCSGYPQLAISDCPADLIDVRIPQQNDICRDLQNGLYIWTSFPFFDTTGGDHCYENMTDTVNVAPCPVYPSNGIPTIKVIRN